MDILLISTTDLGGRSDLRERMLASMTASQRMLPQDKLTLALLYQNCRADDLAALAPGLPSFVAPLAIDRRISLSAARNMLLRRARMPADGIVAFPDDDCWYPEGFLVEVVALFKREATLDFWFCRYGSAPTLSPRLDANLHPAPMSRIVRNASSNTIFMRGSVVAAVGEFDEALGVGTKLGGSEDLDFAVRAAASARRIVYDDGVLVGHRDKDAKLRARYYPSSLIVLARHVRLGTGYEFVRKLAVGAVLLLRRELSWADFWHALRGARGQMRGRRSA